MAPRLEDGGPCPECGDTEGLMQSTDGRLLFLCDSCGVELDERGVGPDA